ncbi:MAG: glycosyltransferase family 1 protein [Herpetosiphonaceae bacterium]|nr:glycosyltransferase family 1 protein [Herpetosiphonaceae bacterium]
MAKFLITVWPFAGHYFPMTAIAHELRAHGHDVAFYTGAKICPTLEGEGFTCFPFRQLDEQHVADVLDNRTTFASMRHPLNTRNVMRRWIVETFPGQIADLAQVLKQWPPDVILSETSMWSPAAVFHESHKLPVAVFSNTLGCTLPRTHARKGAVRPTWGGRLRSRILGVANDFAGAPFRNAINQARQKYSLPPLAVSINEQLGRMPLYMLQSVPEFDYQRQDLPSSVHYIGPCVWNKPQTEPAPSWLGEVPHDQPWVHVSEGTINSQQPIVLRAAAQGLANLPMHVIMTTGGNRDPESLGLGVIAPNVRVVRWVAHSDLLPQTDVFITTGGSGQVITALQYGVPMVLIPTEWDKPANTQRVVDAGAGVRVNPSQCTPERLREAVEHVLKDPSFRQNAQRLQGIMAQYGGPRRATELLEQLLAHQPTISIAEGTY